MNNDQQSRNAKADKIDELSGNSGSYLAVLAAFKELVLQDRYDEIRVGDIVRESNVGRSTFYEHFQNKDDLLVKSLHGIFRQLAGIVDQTTKPDQLEQILQHFHDNQIAARSMLNSQTMHVLAQGLAYVIKNTLPRTLILPEGLIARQLADTQLSLIRAWLHSADQVPCSHIANALFSSVHNIVEGYRIGQP